MVDGHADVVHGGLGLAPRLTKTGQRSCPMYVQGGEGVGGGTLVDEGGRGGLSSVRGTCRRRKGHTEDENGSAPGKVC